MSKETKYVLLACSFLLFGWFNLLFLYENSFSVGYSTGICFGVSVYWMHKCEVEEMKNKANRKGD